MARPRLNSAAALITLLSHTSGCGPVIDNPHLAVVEVSGKQTGATIDLELDQQLVIGLESNRTTGYEWVLANLNRQILETVEDEPRYESNPNPGGLLGVGGTERWSFKPVKPGETFIRFEYRRPWTNGRKAIRSAVFKVRVR